MNPKTRTRLLWTMTALVIGYALFNVLVYFLSGSYGVGWFLTSLAVYGAVFVAAIFLLVADKSEDEPRPEPTVNVAVVSTRPEPRGPVIETMPVPVDAPRDAE